MKQEASKINKSKSDIRYPASAPAKLVVIVGETATGKSRAGLELSRKFDGEIISADSWTVRAELDIGTAKPREEERAEIPHHLLDMVAPCEPFSAAVFKDLANEAIADIASRRKLPIMVGGTGLYVDSVLFDYSFQPPPPEELREQLKQKSIGELITMAEEQELDMTGIDTRNHRRLMRLIETQGSSPTRSEKQRGNTLVVGLSLKRSDLRRRIEKRVDSMFKRGLKYEAKGLAEKYGWDCEGLKGIGYREWQDYFDGELSLQATRRKIVKSTLDLARRQRTWFKRNRNIVWLDDSKQAQRLVEKFLKNSF